MTAGVPIEVVAGVLRDAGGRVLLAQRMAPRDWAGRWEFPGGKYESGEDADAALLRELHEELGITVLASQPLLRVPWREVRRTIVLDVREVTCWQGALTACEGQHLRWQPLAELVRAEMPPADWPAVRALRLPPLLRITPPHFGRAQLPQMLAALDVDDALLRLRLADPAHERALAAALIEAAPRVRHRLLLGGDVEGARALACGVQLRAAQLRGITTRPLPENLWCAASCHGAADLARAQALDCDCAVLGPVLPTPTHAGAPALGWRRFAQLCEQAGLPVYALGGVGPEDRHQARAAGAQGTAGIRAFWA